MNNNESTNTTDKELSPYILFQPYSCKITFGKDIIRSLGFPTHICLRVNESTNSVAVMPCKPEDVMSFKVPENLFTDHHTVFRISSKSFIFTLLMKYELDPKYNYEYKGIYSEKLKAVIFSLADENKTIKEVRTVLKESQA